MSEVWTLERRVASHCKIAILWEVQVLPRTKTQYYVTNQPSTAKTKEYTIPVSFSVIYRVTSKDIVCRTLHVGVFMRTASQMSLQLSTTACIRFYHVSDVHSWCGALFHYSYRSRWFKRHCDNNIRLHRASIPYFFICNGFYFQECEYREVPQSQKTWKCTETH